MMIERLFVYGSLREPAVQMRIIGRTIEGTPDVLEGYTHKWVQFPEGEFPMIVPEPGSEVDGLILDVTADEMPLLDCYETDAYRRIRVTLKSGIETWVYAE
jgi:gamma-glutamylcyclotransferase (GGCT)/AIG2-like uncharacterized protein YtfP